MLNSVKNRGFERIKKNNNNIEVTDILYNDGKCQLRKTMKGLRKKGHMSTNFKMIYILKSDLRINLQDIHWYY